MRGGYLQIGRTALLSRATPPLSASPVRHFSPSSTEREPPALSPIPPAKLQPRPAPLRYPALPRFFADPTSLEPPGESFPRSPGLDFPPQKGPSYAVDLVFQAGFQHHLELVRKEAARPEPTKTLFDRKSTTSRTVIFIFLQSWELCS